ncbi:MAG: biopolymer transporter ExbD [Henriciella sp.]|jgi:biopolymer transport protein ExbD
MKRSFQASKREPIISLINIVFLILIFFMVAGSLSGNRPAGIEFVQAQGLDCCSEHDALDILADGTLVNQGTTLASLDQFIAEIESLDATIRLRPDRNYPASELLKRMDALQAAGATHIVILTEQG